MGTRFQAVCIFGLLTALLWAVPASAEDLLAKQAERQLEFAWTELEAGNFERSAESAARAIAASPLLYEARLVLALSYAGMKDYPRSQFALEEYIRALAGLKPRAEATDLARELKKKRRWDGPIPGEEEAPAQASAEPTSPPPLLLAGIVSLGAAGGLAGGAAGAAAQGDAHRVDYYDGGTARSEFPALVEQWEQARTATTVLGIAAGAAGIAGGVLVAVGLATREQPTAWVVPQLGPEGVGVAIGGRW